MLKRVLINALSWLLLRRRRRWVTIEVNDLDLKIACDPEERPTTRRAAWERYEVERWLAAYRARGLLIRNMDSDRAGPDGESMQTLVWRRVKMPELSGAKTELR